jgi:hypothetical protein
VRQAQKTSALSQSLASTTTQSTTQVLLEYPVTGRLFTSKKSDVGYEWILTGHAPLVKKMQVGVCGIGRSPVGATDPQGLEAPLTCLLPERLGFTRNSKPTLEPPAASHAQTVQYPALRGVVALGSCFERATTGIRPAWCIDR